MVVSDSAQPYSMKHVVSGMDPYLNLDGSTGAYVENVPSSFCRCLRVGASDDQDSTVG
jgi:hypothetical protein